MTNSQFCYWLQGYFELRDNGAALSSEQREIILEHLDLCAKYMETRGGLGPSLMAIRALLTTTPDCTDAIKQLIADVFEHIIDPKAGDATVQAELDGIHSGLSTKPDYRC